MFAYRKKGSQCQVIAKRKVPTLLLHVNWIAKHTTYGRVLLTQSVSGDW